MKLFHDYVYSAIFYAWNKCNKYYIVDIKDNNSHNFYRLVKNMK